MFRKTTDIKSIIHATGLFPLPLGERVRVRGNLVKCNKYSCFCAQWSTIWQSHRIHKTGFFKLTLVILAFLFLSCAEKPVYREEVFYPKIKRPAVIVKLLETENSLTISSKESFSIRCFPSEGEPSIYYASGKIDVKFFDEGIVLNQNTQGMLEGNLCKVSFLPKKENSCLYLNDKPYRGILEITLGKNPESLLALNIIHLEDYLQGVVPAEMGKLSHPELEALKAQAITARTYALFRMGQKSKLESSGAEREYDLEATVADQVYSGVSVEDPLVNRAIQLTQGKVLTYQGKLVCAYYHANCGGMTEYIEKVWDKPPEPYLIPIDDNEFCSWAKNYRWEESWTKDVLQKNIKEFLDSNQNSYDEKLRDADASFDLLDLKIKERALSGRVELLEVVTDKGAYPLRSDKIRWALKRANNHNYILPSTCFDLEIKRGDDNSIQRVTARGRGNGHGVGMCQTGAIGMAKAGYSYKNILMHYYPGIKITKCY